jgi:hypothetical protein
MASSSSHHSIWYSVLSGISKALVSSVEGKLSDYAISQVLQLLSGQRDDELALLKAISQDVKDLKGGPYLTGLDWLNNAANKSIPGDEQTRRIKKAEEYFREALGQEWRDKFRVALIHYHLGICYLMLAQTQGKSTEFWYREAGDHIEEAYNSAMDYLDETINRKVSNLKVENKIITGVGVSTFWFGGGYLTITPYSLIRGSRPEKKFFKQIEPVYLFLNDLQNFKAGTPIVPLNFQRRPERFLPYIEYIRREAIGGDGTKGTFFEENK